MVKYLIAWSLTVIAPGLKKPSLKTNDFSSFRLISNFKLWLFRLTFYISDNNLHELYQFAYKPYYSTESALVKVHDDSLRPLDNQNSVILLLLDPSAASDTVDHNILLSRLKPTFGINGIALDWFRSYLPTGLTLSLFWVVDLLSDFSWPVCHKGVSWSLYYPQCILHLLEMASDRSPNWV